MDSVNDKWQVNNIPAILSVLLDAGFEIISLIQTSLNKKISCL